MKLTIKNYNKCGGWTFPGPKKDLTWMLRGVNEKTDVYEFRVSLLDVAGNAIKADTIILSREPWEDADGDISYNFLPHKRQTVTAKWFTIGNAYTAFESEIERLNENY